MLVFVSTLLSLFMPLRSLKTCRLYGYYVAVCFCVFIPLCAILLLLINLFTSGTEKIDLH